MKYFILYTFILGFVNCGYRRNVTPNQQSSIEPKVADDTTFLAAKKLLQGVWVFEGDSLSKLNFFDDSLHDFNNSFKEKYSFSLTDTLTINDKLVKLQKGQIFLSFLENSLPVFQYQIHSLSDSILSFSPLTSGEFIIYVKKL